MNNSYQAVKQAAIVQHGIVFTMPRPARHGHLIQAIARLGWWPLPVAGGQGFMLEDGTFATRDHAQLCAYLNGQIKKARFDSPRVFCSEDLW